MLSKLSEGFQLPITKGDFKILPRVYLRCHGNRKLSNKERESLPSAEILFPLTPQRVFFKFLFSVASNLPSEDASHLRERGEVAPLNQGLPLLAEGVPQHPSESTKEGTGFEDFKSIRSDLRAEEIDIITPPPAPAPQKGVLPLIDSDLAVDQPPPSPGRL